MSFKPMPWADDPSAPKEVTSRRPSSNKLRLSRGLFAVAVVALAAGALNGAWQRTRLRECYLPELEARARRSPADAPLLALLGARLMEASELDAAADALRRAAAAGDNTDEVWLSLAATNAARGQRGAALGDLALAQQTHGDAPALRAAQARVQALPPGAAGAALTRALCPQGPQAILGTHAAGSFLNGAQEWWGRHHPESSGYATRQDWVAQQPEDAQALRLWGLALERNRRLPEAGAALERAVAQAPRSPQAHLALADFLSGVASPARTGLEYIAALKYRPDSLPALLGLGGVGIAENTKYAVAAYARATQVAPQSADAWVGLGHAYSLTRLDSDKSVAAFETAARLAPERSDFFSFYADVLRKRNRWDEAEALLRQRLKIAPDDAFSHYLLGTVLLDSRPSPAREAEAEAQTREALRFAPHSPEGKDQLAEILLGRGDAAGALTLLQDSLSDDAYNVNTLNTLARAYRQCGKTSQAAAAAARAKSLRADQDQRAVLTSREHKDFTDPHLHEQLALLFGRDGHPDRERQEQELARLLRADPAKVSAQQKELNADLDKLLLKDVPGGK